MAGKHTGSGARAAALRRRSEALAWAPTGYQDTPVPLPVTRPKTPVDLARARERISWVEDDDLAEVESKSKVGAAALGFFTWGGGRLYIGDILRGVGAIGALIAWMVVSSYLPESLGTAVYAAVGAACGLWSYRGAKAVNRFAATATELRLRQGPDPSAYRLLTAAASANPALAGALPPPAAEGSGPPGPHADVVERLRKVAALHHRGVLRDSEARERRVDLLTAVAPSDRAELDELLFALLPLVDEGVLTREDFDFVMQIGGER
jgi:hypothetical protein